MGSALVFVRTQGRGVDDLSPVVVADGQIPLVGQVVDIRAIPDTRATPGATSADLERASFVVTEVRHTINALLGRQEVVVLLRPKRPRRQQRGAVVG